MDLQKPENKRRIFNDHRVGISTEFIIPGLIRYPAFKVFERQVLEKEKAAHVAAPAPAGAFAD